MNGADFHLRNLIDLNEFHSIRLNPGGESN